MNECKYMCIMCTGYPKLLVFHITVVAGTQSLVQQSILKPGLGTQYQQQLKQNHKIRKKHNKN